MLTMRQKKAVTRELQDRYRKASKKEKKSYWMNLLYLPAIIALMPVSYSSKAKCLVMLIWLAKPSNRYEITKRLAERRNTTTERFCLL